MVLNSYFNNFFIRLFFKTKNIIINGKSKIRLKKM